jgi:hypothetical protein
VEAPTAGLGVVAHPTKQAPAPIQATKSADRKRKGKTVMILYLNDAKIHSADRLLLSESTIASTKTQAKTLNSAKLSA